jgi:hypothetical protein
MACISFRASSVFPASLTAVTFVRAFASSLGCAIIAALWVELASERSE